MASKDQVTKLDVNMRYTSGTAIDLAGADSCTIVLPVTDGTTVTLTECDTSGGTYTAVDNDFIALNSKDTNLSSALNVVTASDATNASAVIGYVGHKRYLKATVATAVANTSIGIVFGDLRDNPETPSHIS